MSSPGPRGSVRREGGRQGGRSNRTAINGLSLVLGSPSPHPSHPDFISGRHSGCLAAQDMVCLRGDDEPALGSERRGRGWGPSPTLLWARGLGGALTSPSLGLCFPICAAWGQVPLMEVGGGSLSLGGRGSAMPGSYTAWHPKRLQECPAGRRSEHWADLLRPLCPCLSPVGKQF